MIFGRWPVLLILLILWNEGLPVATFETDLTDEDVQTKLSPEIVEKDAEYLLMGHFEKFVEDFEKYYESEEEKLARFDIFKNNLKEIKKLNEEANGMTEFGVTQFSDLTSEEFKSKHLTLQPNWMTDGSSEIFKSPLDDDQLNAEDSLYSNLEDPMSEEGPYSGTTPKPPSPKPKPPGPKPPPGPPGPMVAIDWRTKGTNPRVQDQGNCGSCYTFACAGVTEILYSIKLHKELLLSEQQLVSCTLGFKDGTNDGCMGGWFEPTLKYIKTTGLVPESAMPYKGVNGTCPKALSGTTYKIKSYALVEGEKNMLSALSVSPLVTALNAKTYQHYKSGILATPPKDCSPKNLNHAVITMGHGFEPAKGSLPAQTYWIIKNSWASNWGEKGFVRMASFRGTCGIGQENFKVTI